MKNLLFAFALLLTIGLTAQNYNPIINYSFNGTPTNGVKINTNIPYSSGYGMPTLIIEGYDYSGKSSIGLILNWYVYNGNFINHSVSSFGNYTPEIKLYNENNKIVIFINDKKYYNRFTIRGYANFREKDADFEGWTITDELPTGANETIMEYKNKFAGDINLPNGIWNKHGNLGVGTTNPNSKIHAEVDSNNVSGIYTGRFVNNSSQNGSQHGIYIQVKENGGDLIRTSNNGGANQSAFIVKNNGNVGIGKTSPSQKLDVNGHFKLDALGSSHTNIQIGHDINDRIYADNSGTKHYGGGMFFRVTPDPSLNISSNYIDVMMLDDKGNVGIRTTNTKGFTLGVNGKIAATEVKVATYANWADFVFEKEYNLPTLTEVENHIKEKGHLQNIPSAKEVKKNGFFLGEMNAKLLQKIEELTLYTIQQEKRLEKQSDEIDKLKKQNKEIEKLKIVVNQLIQSKK